jgi:hypothetical protein
MVYGNPLEGRPVSLTRRKRLRTPPFTSETVTEGHPDNLPEISDSVISAGLAEPGELPVAYVRHEPGFDPEAV